MATQNINIRVSATGTVTVVRSLNQIAGAASSAISPVARLERALRTAFLALGIRQVLQWADAWTTATNKVAVFANSQAAANQVMNELYDVSQRTRQPMDELVTLYQRITIAARDLNTSVEENIKFTEGVGKALAVQGTSTNAARGALLQLSQAMGEGIVRAQEFNSIVENMPLVLQLVAREMHGATGSISSLRKQMLTGKLMSKDFYEAFMRAQPQLEEMFAKTNKTFGQAFTVFENGMIRFLGQINQSLGISTKFYAIMKLIADNLGVIGAGLFVVAVGVAAAFAPAIVTAFAAAVAVAAGAVGRLTLLLLANPFVAIAVATAAVIAFGDSWDAGIDGATTVRDLLIAFGQTALSIFNDVLDFVLGVWDAIENSAITIYESITGTVTTAVGGWFSSYSDFFSDVGTGFAGMLRAIAKVMDAIAGLITGVVIAIGRIFSGLPAVIKGIFQRVYNEIANWMEKGTNVVIEGINYIRSKVGLGLLDAVKFDRMEVDEAVFKTYGENISKSITDGFDAQGGYMQKKVEELFGNAQQIAYRRLSGKTVTGDLSQKPPTVTTTELNDNASSRAADKLASALDSLLGKIDPVGTAMRELAKSKETLTAAVAAGLITGQQHENYLIALTRYYSDLINPLGAVMRELEQEAAVMKLGVSERERDIQFRQIQQDLLKQNIVLTELETKAIKDRILANQETAAQMAIEDALIENSIGKRLKFIQTLEAIARLKSDPLSGFTATDSTEALQGLVPDLFSGTQEAIDLQVQQFRDMYAKIELMRSLDLVSEQTASQMRAKVAVGETQFRVANYSQMFGALASLSGSGNRKLAAIGKAAAATQATIDGVLAVQKALASAPPPINYAMAAAVGIQAASNVARILSSNANFANGGDFTIGGSGGIDSQVVAFRGSPGERVSVSTPQQVRKGTATKEDASRNGNVTVSPRIINVIDPAMISDYLTTADGEEVILNMMRRNSDSIQSIVGGQ
jgi:tape measure domain-containing protein